MFINVFQWYQLAKAFRSWNMFTNALTSIWIMNTGARFNWIHTSKWNYNCSVKWFSVALAKQKSLSSVNPLQSSKDPKDTNNTLHQTMYHPFLQNWSFTNFSSSAIMLVFMMQTIEIGTTTYIPWAKLVIMQIRLGTRKSLNSYFGNWHADKKADMGKQNIPVK